MFVVWQAMKGWARILIARGELLGYKERAYITEGVASELSKYWSKLTAGLVPYVPGEQPKDKTYIKLNTNENPYPPSPRVLAAIQAAADGDLRLYPDPTCDLLREKAAAYYKLSKEQVFVGNGSDEVLAFAFPAFFNPGETILFPDVTYSFYPVYANFYGLRYETIPVDDELMIRLEDYDRDNGGMIVPNPNAPTAACKSLAELRDLLDLHPDRVVIIDEAYIDFGGDSAIALIPEYPNLLVVQTLSKSRSLAGLRVGFALGQAHLIEGLDRVKNSFNSYTLDRLALAGAVAALEDEAYFEQTRQQVIATREWTTARLQALGFHVIPSVANFVFIRHTDKAAADLFSELREAGILVRYFNKPRIDNYLRVSIGTDDEMRAFAEAIARIVQR